MNNYGRKREHLELFGWTLIWARNLDKEKDIHHMGANFLAGDDYEQQKPH